MNNEHSDRGHHDPAARPTEGALHTIGVLFEPGDVIEIRALDVGRTADRAGITYSGYFDFENSDVIAPAIQRIDGRAEGVYVVLNRLNPNLLARSHNRLQAKPKQTTSDNDILQRRWLYIDADPVRPAGISSTDEEHRAALQRAQEIREYLRSSGWPEPLFADSGNGAHLLYRLPAIDLSTAGTLVKASLNALAAKFSDAVVTIDESTASAARLCKLYGTMARKGDSTRTRPHRRAHLIDEPEQIEAVKIEILEALAREVGQPARPQSRAETKTRPAESFKIEEWLRSSGLDVIKGPEPYEGGDKWTLRTCPFSPEHVKPVIIQFPSGALVYKCLHKSCALNDWRALRRLMEPGYREPAFVHGRTVSRYPAPDHGGTTHLIANLSEIPSVWDLEANLVWCVEDMIAQGSVTLISAESGTGKTWLAYYIAACIARGVPVIGRAVKESDVLYLDGENPLYLVKQRLEDLGVLPTPRLRIWGGWNDCSPPQPNDPLVLEFARQQQGVIIFDSLIEFHTGSEQSSTETRAFMRQLRALANFGSTVIVLHNAGKAETAKLYRGSSDIKAAVDTAYQLRAAEGQSEKLGKLHLNCFKGRLAPGQSFGLEFRENEGFVPCEVPQTRTVQEIIAEILNEHRGRNQSQIVTLARARGCTKRQAEDCLKNRPWKRTPGPNNSTLYDLPPDGLD